MVWHNVVVVRELMLADGADSVLFGDFPLQKLPHFCGGSEFPISSRVMRIFNALHTEPYSAYLWDLLPAAAENRSLDGTEFVATESHGFLLARPLILLRWIVVSLNHARPTNAGLTRYLIGLQKTWAGRVD